MLQSELVRILSFIFLAFGSLTTIIIVIKSIKNYRLANSKKSSVIIRFTVVALVWAIFSLYILLLLAVNSMGNRIGPEPEIGLDARTAYLVGGCLVWMLVGGGLIYWTNKPPKIENIK